MPGIATTLKGKNMNRNIASALAMGTATAAAAFAAAAIASSNAFADDITIDNTPFVSSLSRDEVNAELKVPYSGGNPWSGQYNMFPSTSTTTASEQARGAYKFSRDEANALNGEDSGSAYFLKSASPSGANPAATMGAPAR
jgi:hypothetical protein